MRARAKATRNPPTGGEGGEGGEGGGSGSGDRGRLCAIEPGMVLLAAVVGALLWFAFSV